MLHIPKLLWESYNYFTVQASFRLSFWAVVMSFRAWDETETLSHLVPQ